MSGLEPLTPSSGVKWSPTAIVSTPQRSCLKVDAMRAHLVTRSVRAFHQRVGQAIREAARACGVTGNTPWLVTPVLRVRIPSGPRRRNARYHVPWQARVRESHAREVTPHWGPERPLSRAFRVFWHRVAGARALASLELRVRVPSVPRRRISALRCA